MNRRLIRPNFSEIKEKIKNEPKQAPPPKKLHPPYDTFAENYYHLKQMNKKTPMAVVLTDGEVVEGYIEWYDRHCIKLNRDNAPNLLVYKNSIKYLYKLHENREAGESGKDREQDKKR
jgi:RNA chaperone Hfq